MSFGDVAVAPETPKAEVGTDPRPFAAEMAAGMAPGAGFADAAGRFPAFSDKEQEFYDGLLTNIQNKKYGMATMQGLAMLGDAMWAGGPLAGAVGTAGKVPLALARGAKRASLLYRGLSPNPNLNKSRYPGTFWTEDPVVAKRYARTGGTVVQKDDVPLHPFVVDDVPTLPASQKEQLSTDFKQFMNENYPDMDIADTQLFDNLTPDNPADFVYPTQADVDFLKSRGHDSVYFSREGGEEVKTWFVFDSE